MRAGCVYLGKDRPHMHLPMTRQVPLMHSGLSDCVDASRAPRYGPANGALDLLANPVLCAMKSLASSCIVSVSLNSEPCLSLSCREQALDDTCSEPSAMPPTCAQLQSMPADGVRRTPPQ